MRVVVGVVVAAHAVQVKYALVNYVKVKVAPFGDGRVVVAVGFRAFRYVFVVCARRAVGTKLVSLKVRGFRNGSQARVANAAAVCQPPVSTVRDYAARLVVSV